MIRIDHLFYYGDNLGSNPYHEWDAYLSLAENDDLAYIVSNTTEAGIQFVETDERTDTPPQSFPGKLTAFLYV